MSLYKSVDELIGNTPLMELNNICRENDVKAKIIAKLEYLNPAGSVKDRVALNMIKDAEKKGILKANSVIIEPTSGNTGIGLCAVGAARGYKCIIVMPETMSKERIMTMRAYGAEVVLTEGAKGMSGAIEKAQSLAKTTKDSFLAGQFVNPANPEAHCLTTGPEIYEDLNGNVDAFVAGVGTGGTITGVAKFLKEKNPNIKIIGIEPKASAVLSGGKAGAHSLQGIGAGFVPDVLETALIDEIITVSEDEAYHCARQLGKREGILVGISSGAALQGAITLAKREDMKDKNIVVLLPDIGDRYLSTNLFSE